MTHRSLYAAFDRYPAPKGAATHIRHAAATLFDVCGGGLLYTLGDRELPARQSEAGGVEIRRCVAAAAEPNLLRRTEVFAAGLDRLLDADAATLELCQFRDPWSGLPILTHPLRRCPTVYEVNGLPSVELPARFPLLGRDLVRRLRETERFCWERADLVVTPGRTLAANLVALGVDAGKIAVVPNGADLRPLQARHPGAPRRYVTYVGALQPWQGVDTALRAFARILDLDAHLVIVTAARHREAGPLRRLARRLGVDSRTRWHHRVDQESVAAWLQHAELSLAPLADCGRNVAQGCAPLKVVESLAAGTPVVASDLPVVREVVVDGVHGRLVPPDRPSALARAVRVLLEDPPLLSRMSEACRERVAAGLTWGHTDEEHRRLLEGLRAAPAGGRRPAYFCR